MQVTEEQFTDVGRGVTLCHQGFGDPGDPPLLLVMGLGTQMIAWHDDLCRSLAERGYHVVRFDNRDIGRSTHFQDLRTPTMRQLVTRRFRPEQYTLNDMADDTAGLLRELELAPAHVVGASMGGMIGQMLAARNPASVRSLVSLMSSTGHRLHGQPKLGVYATFLRRRPSDREAYLEYMETLYGAIGSPPPLQDVDDVRELAAQSLDRDDDARATARQLAAILTSGNRTRTLRLIKAPTLVIHGTADRLVSPSGGKATALAIPNARLMTIEGMGHDLPRPLWPQLVDAIAGHARAVDGGAERVAAGG